MAAKAVIEGVKTGLEKASEAAEKLELILKAYDDENAKADLQRNRYSPTEVLSRLEQYDFDDSSAPQEWIDLSDGVASAFAQSDREQEQQEQEWGPFAYALDWSTVEVDGSGHLEVTTLPRVQKLRPSGPYMCASPNSDAFQPPKE